MAALGDAIGDEPVVDAVSVGESHCFSNMSASLEAMLRHSSAHKAQRLRNLDGQMPIHLAAAQGHVPICEALLEAGAPVNACTMRRDEYHSGNWGKQTEDGLVQLDTADKTPLHLATGLLLEQYEEDEDTAFDTGLVQLLLKHNADVNALDLDKQTPLHIAVMGGMIEVVGLLADAKADLTLSCKAFGNGNTALHQATILRHIPMIELLAARGAPLDAHGRDGWTPLCLAVRSNATDAVTALIAAGASTSAACGNGKTPLEIATINKRAAIVELLSQ